MKIFHKSFRIKILKEKHKIIISAGLNTNKYHFFSLQCLDFCQFQCQVIQKTDDIFPISFYGWNQRKILHKVAPNVKVFKWIFTPICELWCNIKTIGDAVKKSAKFRGFVLNCLTPYPPPPYLGQKNRTFCSVCATPPSFMKLGHNGEKIGFMRAFTSITDFSLV